MGLFMSKTIRPQPRRAQRHSAFATSLNPFEDRTLLSGVAIYPQPACEVTKDVSTAAAPPGDFAGHWIINTSEGNGTADITQEGNQLQFVLDFGGFNLPASGKVKGDTATAKIKASVMGINLKGKIVSTLTGPNSLEGTANVKVTGLGKLSLDLSGTRT